MDLKQKYESSYQLPIITEKQLQWISVILRLSIFSLFTAAAISKINSGVAGTVEYFVSIFNETWLPIALIKPYATAILFIEIILSTWILIGIRLRAAWIATSLVTITLAFGMLVAGEFGTASDNYIYVVISCLGLLVSSYDRFTIEEMLKRE